MNELDYEKELIGALKFYGYDVQKHEDKHENFIPDLSFAGERVDGWIEVKYLEEAPRSLGSIPHWTPGQEDWLVRRSSRGAGLCFLWMGTPSLHCAWKAFNARGLRDHDLYEAANLAWARSLSLGGAVEAFTARLAARTARATGGAIPVPGHRR